MVEIEIYSDMATGDLLEATSKVSAVLAEGGLAIIPTETVYGIACDLRCEEACERIYSIKQRDPAKPFSWHISGLHQIDFSVENTYFHQLAKHFWPGPLTMVINNPAGESIGLRCPEHDVFRSISDELGYPMLASSANLSGYPSPVAFHDISEDLKASVDIVVQSEDCVLGYDSTVVDLRGNQMNVLREGYLSTESINQVIEEGAS